MNEELRRGPNAGISFDIYDGRKLRLNPEPPLTMRLWKWCIIVQVGCLVFIAANALWSHV